ncbi:MFS transporter [Sphingosinithalassobacter portus]|uniref:MFS transporter n=1 Tax=Stakelama portus TaxID=2676234 RepID=UPI000D6E5CC3|nr:MFS transporter [Sphingosinithalassobacter portus]
MAAEPGPDARTADVESASPFAVPIFRSIWTANLVSNFGYIIQSVGAAWLMTELAQSRTMVALVQASVTLPVMLLALAAGAIADNFDRRKVMLAAQFFMLTVSLVLSVLTALHLMTPLLLLAMTFLIGCGMALNSPAWQASVGDMVPKQALSAAVSYNSVAFNIARSAGPAVGGAIVAVANASAAFLANCVSYIGLIVVLLRWKTDPAPAELPPERIGSAVASGVRYVAMSPDLVRVLIRSVFFAAGASAISALLPLVARDLMQGGAVTYGILLGAFGVGAVGGALLGARLRHRFAPQRLVGAAGVAVALGVAGVAFSTTPLAAAPVLALAGGGWMMAMAALNATIQLASPRWVVARAIATYQTAAFGGLAFGAWIFGMIAASHGTRTALLAAAALQLVGLVLGYFIRIPDIDHLNLDPLRRWSEPSTQVPIESRSGPLTIALTYEIDPADIDLFLAAMAERRRIRRRDGARRWSLSRDLAQPRLWIESYQVSTWLDYVRHNYRRTHADAANLDRIMALHRGQPPVVQRLIEIHPGSVAASNDPPPPIRDPLPDYP